LISLADSLCKDDAIVRTAMVEALVRLAGETGGLDEHIRTPASSAFTVATLLAGLGKSSTLSDDVLHTLLEHYGWHVGVLTQLAQLAPCVPSLSNWRLP
jgi:hypothetical protein